MGKKLVMAQKRGETRALCLGVAMVVCAAITYYVLGTTVLPLYQKRYGWTSPLSGLTYPTLDPLRVVRTDQAFLILRLKGSNAGGAEQ